MNQRLFQSFLIKQCNYINPTLSLVYLIFTFEMYSLVINKTKLVKKAALLGIILPAPVLIKPIVKLLIVEADFLKSKR